ncbi:Cellulase (glycosyl hydrolase family 5) [Opitutaceae bacterium TAV1]|nr:Cellulase (glycosyl hydrolase family 5) [Opitutaceae bacterium TAV1]
MHKRSRPLPLLAALLALPFACLAQAATDSEPIVKHPRLGTCVHFHQTGKGWDVDTVMPLIAQSGVSWIRDEISWASLEREKGVYVIPEHDIRWIEAAHKAGLKILLLFNTRGNKLYDNIYDPDAYARAAAWLAKELDGKVQAMEIMNEPFNFKGMGTVFGGTWNGREPDNSTSPWVHHYVKLLNAAARAIKAANPRMTVVGLGAEAPVNFRMLEIGIASEVDGIADHPYSRRVIPELVLFAATDGILKRDGIATADQRGTYASQVRMYRERSARFNGPKQFWITETGFTTYSGVDRQLHAGFTEEAQARYLQRRIVEALGLGVDMLFQYDFKNDGRDPNRAQHHFGMINWDLSPKPALGAVNRVATALATCEPAPGNAKITVTVFPHAERIDAWPIVWDGTKIAAPGTIPVHHFVDQSGTPVIALWSAERAGSDQHPRHADIELATASGSAFTLRTLKVHDLWTGKTRTMTPRQKNANTWILEQFVVPDTPVLITPATDDFSTTAAGSPVLTTSPSPDATAANDAVSLFARDRSWKFNPGKEFPGATGKLTRTDEDDTPVVTVDYDFTGGGRYVSADSSFGITQSAGEIRFFAKSGNPLLLAIRLIDSTGQTFQIKRPYNQTGEWQPFRIDLADIKGQSWGGAGDGKPRFPLKQIRICISATGKGAPRGGQVTFANIAPAS